MHSRTLPCKILSGQSLTDAVSLGGGRLSAIYMPSGWDAASITFQASYDGANWQNLYDDTGTELSVTAAASHVLSLDPSRWIGIQYVKLRSGTSGLAVNQTADRTIQLILVE